jgi:hypothetical protein
MADDGNYGTILADIAIHHGDEISKPLLHPLWTMFNGSTGFSIQTPHHPL